MEIFRLSLEITGACLAIGTFIFLALQIRKERKLEEYKMLQTLEEKYTTLLWKSSEDSVIDNVWKPIPLKRKKKFESLIKTCNNDSWPLWEAMNKSEKQCYRFTRAGLEILEQSFFAKKKGWINDEEIWKKWQGWMKSWNNTNTYLPYVRIELENWFSASFLTYLESLAD